MIEVGPVFGEVVQEGAVGDEDDRGFGAREEPFAEAGGAGCDSA